MSNNHGTLVVFLLINFVVSGCMVTKLKPDKTIKGYAAQDTIVRVPNTLRFDGYLVPAGEYFPTKQSDDWIYYQSGNLVVTHGFTVPKITRNGGIAIKEENGVLEPLIWYWEGGYSAGPSLLGRGLELYKVNTRESIELMHDFPVAKKLGEKTCTNNKPSVRLVIKNVEQRLYSPDFNTMVYDGFSESDLFCNLRGESEPSSNAISVFIKNEPDDSKTSDLNLVATALSAGLIPFESYWRYALRIRVVSPHKSRTYEYHTDSSAFVNIAKDMDEVHAASINGMLQEFFDEIKSDGIHDSMQGLKR